MLFPDWKLSQEETSKYRTFDLSKEMEKYACWEKKNRREKKLRRKKMKQKDWHRYAHLSKIFLTDLKVQRVAVVFSVQGHL